MRSTEVSWTIFSVVACCDVAWLSEEAEVDGCSDSTLPLSASGAGCGSAADKWPSLRPMLSTICSVSVTGWEASDVQLLLISM